MKEKIPYEPFDSFVLRTPLKSFDYLQKLISKKEIDKESLKMVLQDPVIAESIFLASPDLHSQINEWVNGEGLKEKDEDRLIYSVLKYISRLSSRSTPFGLFAGISIGKLDDETNLNIPDISAYKRNLRLDMNYSVALAMHLSTLPEIKKQLKFYPNTSIYVTGDQLRYVEYKYHNAKRIHHIVAVDNSEYLQQILKEASSGESIKNLANSLVGDEIIFEEANEFINELIENQILISELEPSVSGDDLLKQTINVINKLNGVDEIKSILNEIKEDIESINNLPIGIEVSKYFELLEKVKKLEVDFKLKYMFQVDMLKPANDIKINKVLTNNILQSLNILNRITSKAQETNLTKFREAFYERYEDAEIPLLNALDTETGIGYLNYNTGSGIPSPLLDDIALPLTYGDSRNITWNAYNSFMLKKYIEAIKENKSEIEITESEIEDSTLKADWEDLPKTIATMVQLYKGTDGEKVYLKNAGGSSAANLLGRFAYTDSKLNNFIKEIADFEEKIDSDKILAEIVHLPESRTGNVLLRPLVRKYEIPYLAKSNVKKEFQLLPEDLMISVKRNQIILRSKRLNKTIIPHLSNAHNFSNNALPVYQFLCDMQTYNLRGGVGFSWGSLQNEFDFLPRVRYKNIIFSLAEWRIKKDDIKSFVDLGDDTKLFEEIQKWRHKFKIPVWVSLIEGDNKLTLNLENMLSIKTLISLVKKRPNFNLIEFYLNNENALIKNQDESYANEFIFAFKKHHNKKID